MAMAQRANSLAHTKWLCKYHIVFAPKYRRKAICNQHRKDLGETLRQLCQWKGVEIIEGRLMPDHVHMPVVMIRGWPAPVGALADITRARAEKKSGIVLRLPCAPLVAVRLCLRRRWAFVAAF